MSITLSAGSDISNDIQLDNLSLTDLTDPQNGATTLFQMADPIVAGLNQQVSDFPAASSPVTLTYKSGNNSWTVGDFTFGISGGASCSISVLSQNQALIPKYTKTFPTTIGTGLDTSTNSKTTGEIDVPAGQYYVVVELDLTLAANGSAKVQLGEVGIQGTASTNDTYTVRFCKNVPGAMLLKDALAQAFAGFVLPLHSQTYQHLQPGDYLYHNFNATLNLGFGATFGLNEVYFSGQYKAQIPNSPAAVPTVTTSAKVALQANASLGTTFKYTDSFEAMLWKTDPNAGRLHLYRNHSTDATFNVGATVTVIADPAVSISPLNLSNLAQEALPGGTGTVAGQILQGTAQNDATTWVNDAQNKITSWLKPFQQGKTALQLAIEDENTSTLLLDATFDLTQVDFPSAWKQVLAGDFEAALAQPNGGMSLDPGSGLENYHHEKTDITFNLFGKFEAEWTTAQITNFSVLYAGNNTFDLVENIGLENITNINGSGKEVDLYFAARGTTVAGGGTQIDLPELHVLLKATNNPKFAASLAQFLSLTATGTIAAQLQAQLTASAQQAKSTQTLELVFESTAYGKLNSSTLNPDGTITNENLDQLNYNTFAHACWEAEPGINADVTDFSVNQVLDLTYGVWRTWNILSLGHDPTDPTVFPNRRHPGDPQATKSFIDIHFNSPVALQTISIVLQDASGFMNLCEDLDKLANLPLDGGNSWTNLCADLGQIIHSDISVDYLAPTGYALTELAVKGGAQLALTGPTQGASQEPSITVTLRYS
jgi:hypothetical protein